MQVEYSNRGQGQGQDLRSRGIDEGIQEEIVTREERTQKVIVQLGKTLEIHRDGIVMRRTTGADQIQEGRKIVITESSIRA